MAGIAGSAHANQETIVNTSKGPLKLVYQIFHQNPGQPKVFGAKQSIVLTGNTTIPLSLEGYKHVGIMPIEIEQKTLPYWVAKRCSVKTGDKQPDGILGINYQMTKDGHAELTCSTSKQE